MNIFKRKKTLKDELIDKWLEDAIWHDAGSEEATTARENIVGLMEDKNPRKRLDPNTILDSGVSLASVLLLCNAEKISILPAKAFNLVLKVFKK